jgi:hypothetical protein
VESSPEQPGPVSAQAEWLAQRAARSLDFREGLRSVVALRGELERLEQMHVSAALGAGASWSEVAKELGVSKQAAHRRHAGRTGDSRADPGVRGPQQTRRVLVTGEARRAVQLARQEASALGHSLVGTEHLLLGVLRCEDSVAGRALKALGVEVEAARACAEPTLVEADPGAPAAASGRSRRGLTPHADSVLERTLAQTLARSEGFIGVEHLLLSLLVDERGGASRTLTHLGIEREAVRRQLDQTW